jgi:hypothetical protein
MEFQLKNNSILCCQTRVLIYTFSSSSLFGVVVFHFDHVPCSVGVRCSVLFLPVFWGECIENYKY